MIDSLLDWLIDRLTCLIGRLIDCLDDWLNALFAASSNQTIAARTCLSWPSITSSLILKRLYCFEMKNAWLHCIGLRPLMALPVRLHRPLPAWALDYYMLPLHGHDWCFRLLPCGFQVWNKSVEDDDRQVERFAHNVKVLMVVDAMKENDATAEVPGLGTSKESVLAPKYPDRLFSSTARTSHFFHTFKKHWRRPPKINILC